ncbi:MAG TPA: hypothetical protein PKE12_11355 [Kiritimatiellia bacterium]|nr:hypothetical protein [Kiritimatiellia bacterium]
MKRMALIAAMALVGVAWAGAGSSNQTPEQLRVVLDLVDGSRFIGVPRIAAVPVQTSYANLELPISQLTSIKIAEENGPASLDLVSGEKPKGRIGLDSINLDTDWGNVTVQREQQCTPIKRI